MEDKGPYYRTVPSSPDEDGELSEPEGSAAAPAKKADTPKLTGVYLGPTISRLMDNFMR